MLKLVLIALGLFFLIRIVKRMTAGSETLDRSRSDKSPYETLGLKEGAARDDVVKAWKRLCLENHPDKVAHLDPAIQEMAKRRFQHINEAYQMLTDDPWK